MTNLFFSVKRFVIDLKFLRKILEYTGLHNFVSEERKRGKKIKFTKFVSPVRVFLLSILFIKRNLA